MLLVVSIVLGISAFILLVRKLTGKVSTPSPASAKRPYLADALDCHDEATRLEAARVYRDALWADPMFDYFMPLITTPNRKNDLKRVFELFMWAVGSSFEMCDVVRGGDGAIAAIALWEPHEATLMANLRVARMLCGFVWLLGLRKGFEAASFFMELEASRMKNAPKPHFHLQLLGTDPKMQKQGYGTTVIKAQLARNDAAKVASYLESSNPVNLPFYKKLGFEVVEEKTLPNGHAMHLMLRKPPSA